MPNPGVVTERFRHSCRRRLRHSISQEWRPSPYEHTDLMCAVNVPYRHNSPSTFSHFCNPDDTFRASVFCGQAIDLNGRPGPIRTGDPLLRRQMLYPTELRARGFILSAQYKSQPKLCKCVVGRSSCIHLCKDCQ
jgi:hypothetical protein